MTKKIKRNLKAVVVLFGRLNGLGIVGFADHRDKKKENNIISITGARQAERKAS